MSNVLFELPLHPIGEKRVAILSVTDTLYQTVNLDEMGLDSLPEVLILDDCRYRYAGIEYGRGVYRKEDEVPPTQSPFSDMGAQNNQEMVFDDDYLDDISESLVQAIESTPEPAVPPSTSPPVHNQAHNPACMQCERCQSLTKKLAEMLENPPGFKGIKVGSEHYGNKYIDYGWVEAVRVVQSLMVPHADGTTEKTPPSLVESEDLP